MEQLAYIKCLNKSHPLSILFFYLFTMPPYSVSASYEISAYSTAYKEFVAYNVNFC